MRIQLLSDSEYEQLADDVARVLKEVGYLVDHPLVKAKALGAGCRESAEGRVLFSQGQIEELRRNLSRQAAAGGLKSDEQKTAEKDYKILRAGIGNLTPKYYDYSSKTIKAVDTAMFKDLIKFAHAEPRISSITPLARQDTDPRWEQLEDIVLIAELTDKNIGGVDPITPEAIPYLAEMAAVLGKPVSFIGSCNCVNPPLRLENRTAEAMLIKSRYHIRSMITTMPALGASGPVDIYGSAVLATAEIVGGLILSYIIDPDALQMGYVACGQLDMKTGNITSSTTQTVRLDATVYQAMEKCFGGCTLVGGRGYISAKAPGLQAMFERLLKAQGYSLFVDNGAFGYSGTGNLDNGSVFSPEQYMLDLEIIEALNHLMVAPRLPLHNDIVERIKSGVASGGNFMVDDHTLSHFRDELWESFCFGTMPRTLTDDEIVEKCHRKYADKIAEYKNAHYPDETIVQLKKILQRAKA
ncbi:MAG: trimethylamine methyltransferase family protein [Verrucomicrobia bacterium]|nr:trimethylamine methyltransferase family protein [Verrucomicrobiota bacterium]MBU1735408.1 trimethylamine methyltransferase family protein [Verrucomicrobiota bacterium]MBU1857437.1 trimethylamine methyltransferase family protein [Verrucomicrobiota bacterium]